MTEGPLPATAAGATVKNSLNLEPWWQSGICWFGSGGVIASVGGLLGQVGAHGTDLFAYEPNVTVLGIATLISSSGVLYRRFVPGLKPLFWKWKR